MGTARRALTAVLTVAAAAGLVAGCSDDGDVELVEGVTVEVDALDNTFRPQDVEVQAGTEVLWTNVGRNEHDVAPAEGDDFGVDADAFAPGDTYSFRFTEPGEYSYFCTLHGTAQAGMVGSITVTAGPPDGGEGVTTTDGDGEAAGDGEVINVPEDHETIQEAVDSASPGDMVLVAEGVYNEAVDVTTDGLTIRGADRNGTVLDGEFELENGIRVLGANGVVVENMTARNYARNGFFFTGVDGYRGSYLTAYRNGDYGLYAFDSVNGLFEHSYLSGSPDAGVYIGQCFPCNAVIDDVISEYNGLGYSGTNSGGDLVIMNSIFRFNRAGIVPNSGSYELCYPERDTTIAGNIVYSNNQPDTPAIDVALLAMGNGILSAGGQRNLIVNNFVRDHERTGIGLVPFPEEDASDTIPEGDELDLPCAEARDLPLADPGDIPPLQLWNSEDNEVRGNDVRGSGIADLGFGAIGGLTASLGNCFQDNTFETTAPLLLEQLAPCDGEPTEDDFTAGAVDLVALIDAERPPPGDYRVQPIPPEQEGMDDPEGAPFAPFVEPEAVDIDSIELPTALPG